MTVGVYSILCTANGRTYVGSSIHIEHRWREHTTALDSRRHDNIHLQRAWMKYGKDAFMFSIMEKCEVRMMLALEQRAMDKGRNLFNISKSVQAPMLGRTPTAKHRAAMSKAQRGRHHPDSVRARIGAGNRGKRRTQEAVAAMKSRPVSPETRQRMSEAARARCTPSWRARISALHKEIWKEIEPQQRSARMAPIRAQRMSR